MTSLELTPEQREQVVREWLREQTIYSENPSVFYEPFVIDGRVGYRCQTYNAGDTRETCIYLNPSTDDSDGIPNVFVYTGEENDPADDSPVTYIALEDLSDGPLQACGHNLNQLSNEGDCHGCEFGEEPHRAYA